jgi:hypothetical protein
MGARRVLLVPQPCSHQPCWARRCTSFAQVPLKYSQRVRSTYQVISGVMLPTPLLLACRKFTGMASGKVCIATQLAGVATTTGLGGQQLQAAPSSCLAHVVCHRTSSSEHVCVSRCAVCVRELYCAVPECCWTRDLSMESGVNGNEQWNHDIAISSHSGRTAEWQRARSSSDSLVIQLQGYHKVVHGQRSNLCGAQLLQSGCIRQQRIAAEPRAGDRNHSSVTSTTRIYSTVYMLAAPADPALRPCPHSFCHDAIPTELVSARVVGDLELCGGR